MSFPPFVSYPFEIDSDETLYLVYNTTQSKISVHNIAWSEEISIIPVEEDNDEIWASNGYATVSGELLYYDSVGLDSNGKVNKLKRCLRNIGGDRTQTNEEGTDIFAFVVAEHHNQLANAVIQIEEFVGENFSEDHETLDWRIRNLAEQPLIFDDFSCPDVEFTLNVISVDKNVGTLVQYEVTTIGGGTVEIQFGDGSSSILPNGTHLYAPNSEIDPVAIVTNGDCHIVQTPINRTGTEEPEVLPPAPPFGIEVPVVPQLPNFIFPTQEFPSVDINIPPIVFPCIPDFPTFPDFPSFDFNFPSIDIDIPSIISIEADIPSIITFIPEISLPSVIEFANVPTFTDINFVFPSIVVSITTPEFPSTIEFGDAPSFAPIQFGTPPTVGPIAFGSPPTVGPISFTSPPSIGPITFGTPPSFASITFGPAPVVSVDWGSVPVLSCVLTCPTSSLAVAERNARFNGTNFNNKGFNDKGFNDMETIELNYDMIGFPSEIKLIHDIPLFIPLQFPKEIPVFSFDIPDIKVKGIPDVIKLEYQGPEKIKLDASDIKIPLVFDGEPLKGELKVNWGFDEIEGSDEAPCFKIIPCKVK